MIYVGTAGWSYPDWENVVYPAGKAGDRLRTVAAYLDCVEIDNSFYRPPTAHMTTGWVKTVASQPEFRFLAKAWQRFTHERSTPWTQAEFDLFATGITPLREADRLDALLFQFPWSFRNEAGNRDWLTRVADAFASWPVAVEVRHDSWNDAGFFRKLGVIYCNVDQPQLNHCLPATEIVTAPTGYYRLHGRNAKNWFRKQEEVYGGRYDYLYSPAELDEVAGRVARVAKQTKKTFVVFNNHKDAKAFANSLQLKARVSPTGKLRAPATLLARYPAVREIAAADGGEQMTFT